jgi:hypothetical protein
MKTLIIEIPEPGDERGMFDVVDHEGRRCDGLSWDEMLGQVAMLTIPPSRVGNGFAMHTPDQWIAQREARLRRLQAQRADGGVIAP